MLRIINNRRRGLYFYIVDRKLLYSQQLNPNYIKKVTNVEIFILLNSTNFYTLYILFGAKYNFFIYTLHQKLPLAAII